MEPRASSERAPRGRTGSACTLALPTWLVSRTGTRPAGASLSLQASSMKKAARHTCTKRNRRRSLCPHCMTFRQNALVCMDPTERLRILLLRARARPLSAEPLTWLRCDADGEGEKERRKGRGRKEKRRRRRGRRRRAILGGDAARNFPNAKKKFFRWLHFFS